MALSTGRSLTGRTVGDCVFADCAYHGHGCRDLSGRRLPASGDRQGGPRYCPVAEYRGIAGIVLKYRLAAAAACGARICTR